MKFTSRATPRLTLKAAVSAGLTVALLGTAVGCTVTSGYDNQPVYRDGSFNRASQQLRQDLRRSGYDVIIPNPKIKVVPKHEQLTTEFFVAV